MSQRTPPRATPAADPPPRTTDEALARARRHASAALAETTCAVRALLDAASLATTGAPSDAHAALAGAAAWLDDVAGQLQSVAGRPGAAWLDAVARVLDEEIARWERRGRADADARAVLRAFLGVREILWEFGLRPSANDADDERVAEEADQADAAAPAERTSARAARRDAHEPSSRTRPSRRGPPVRIERVPVEG
jgi:hypothetical protein